MGLQQAPLLIASLLLLCIGSPSGVGAKHSCPPSSCGNLQISYPFRLKSDEPTCGDRRYELTCDGNNRTILDFHSGKYYVQSISYSKGNENIRIIDVGLADDGCALPSHTLSPETLFLHDERFQWLGGVPAASFLNCSKEIQGSGSYVPVHCLSGSNAFVYVVFTSRVVGLVPSCRFLAMVPAYGGGDTEAQVFELLQSGITLTWIYPSCGPVSFVIKDCYMNTRWIHFKLDSVLIRHEY